MVNRTSDKRFDMWSEEEFYDFLNDYELTSMIRNIECQVWVATAYANRRVDFVLTLTNNGKIFVEVDGSYHDQDHVKWADAGKDYLAEKAGIHTLRVPVSYFLKNKQMLANEIEGLIDLLSAVD